MISITTAKVLSAPRKRSIDLLALALIAFAATYARAALGPLQETMQLTLGWSDNWIALIQGPAPGFAMALAAVPIGMLIDRYSRVRLLIAFAILNIVGTLISALTANFALLFAARAVIGVAAPATIVASFSLMADLFSPAQRGRAMMVICFGQIGGGSAVFALGGALVVASSAGVDGWRWSLLWMTAPLVALMLLFPVLREPARAHQSVQPPTTRESVSGLWSHRAVFGPLLLGSLAIGVADCAANVWAAPVLARSFGLSADRVGAIMAAVILISGLAGPAIGGSLVDLCQRTAGPRRTMAVLSAFAVLGAPAGLFALAPNATVAGVVLAFFLGVGGAISVALTTLITVIMPTRLRGLSISVLFATSLLFGVGLAPMAVSLLSEALGGASMLGVALSWICATTSLLCAATFVYGRRAFLADPSVTAYK